MQGLTLDAAQYSRWRRWPDAIMMVAMFCSANVCMAYWMLRKSLCRKSLTLDRSHEASLLERDPWLSSFACGNKKVVLDKPMVGALTWQRCVRAEEQPKESMDWLSANWWWVTPYVSARYYFLVNGAWLLFMPGVLLFPSFFPSWWFSGGRTGWMAVWRVWTLVGWMLHAVLPSQRHVPSPWDAVAAEPFTNTMKVLVKRGIWMGVPWPIHRWLVPAEAILAGAITVAVESRVSPLPLHWYPRALAGLLVGALVSLAANRVEGAAMKMMQELQQRLLADQHMAAVVVAAWWLAHILRQFVRDVRTLLVLMQLGIVSVLLYLSWNTNGGSFL